MSVKFFVRCMVNAVYTAFVWDGGLYVGFFNAFKKQKK